MQLAKRISLFLLTNILVMATISILLKILGVGPYLGAYGLDYQQLAAFCLVWGMGGAFISLLMSRMMAKWSMGVKVIDPQTRDPELAELVQTVHTMAKASGITTMPEVGIYDSPELNAFATGPTKNRALVAVSTGLLQRMNRSELEGVLGHEVAHVANGDMVTMTLIQGVVNAFVMFLARVIAFALQQALRSRDDDESPVAGGFAYHMTVFVLEMVFMILGTIVVAWFSRYREYRADQGGARIAGRESMIAALQKLRATYEIRDDAATSPAFQNMQISGRSKAMMLFSTHPPLEMRIERLMRA